jgi:hypothetical protein
MTSRVLVRIVKSPLRTSIWAGMGMTLMRASAVAGGAAPALGAGTANVTNAAAANMLMHLITAPGINMP